MRRPRPRQAGVALVLAGAGSLATIAVARAHPVSAHPASAPRSIALPAADRASVAMPDLVTVPAAGVAERLMAVARSGTEASRGVARTTLSADARPVPAVAVAPAFVVWPAPGKINGPFGEPRGNGPHPGIDLNGHIGDPVIAAVAGTVVSAGPPPTGFGGYGNLVVVDDGQGFVTLYAHLSAVIAQPGQTLVPGQPIGLIGCTGICTGPHLHFEVRVGGKPVDPAGLLPPKPPDPPL